MIYGNGLIGFYLAAAHFSAVSSNIVYRHEDAGISNHSNSSTFTSNTVFGSVGVDELGVGLDNYGNNNLLESNTAYASAQSIWVEGNNNIAIGNTAYLGRGTTTNYGIGCESSKNILIFNTIYSNTYGIAATDAYNFIFIANNLRSNTSGVLMYRSAGAAGYGVSIGDQLGVGGANTQDLQLWNDGYAHKLYLFNASLVSGTEVNSTMPAGAAVISRKHDGSNGVTKIWGDYSFPANSTETPQDETTDKYNYTDNLWEKSASAHGYYGTGTEDTSLNYDLSAADLSAGPYVYRASYNGTNWDVTRYKSDGTSASVGPATTNSLFTDSNASVNVKFKIDSGASAYVAGDTYTFAVWDASNDTNAQKTVTAQLNNDSITIGSGQTMQLNGQSAGTNLSTLSILTPGSMAYDLTVNSGGTLSGNNNTITVVGNVNGTGGTVNLGTGSTFIQRVLNAKNFGTTSGAAHWTFNDLKFENGGASGFTITTGNGGTGYFFTTGNLTVGKATDSATTTLDNETRDRVLSVGGNLTITSKGVMQASSTVLFGVGGDWSNAGTFTSGTGTVSLAATTPGYAITSGGSSFYNLSLVDTGTYTLQDAMTVTRQLNIGAGEMDAGSQTITLSGTTGTPFLNTGTFTPSSSTVIFSGNYASGNTTIPSVTYNNLTLNNGSETYVLAGTTTTNGYLYIQAGTLDATASNYALNVKGNWTNAGTFTPRNGTVTFNGTGAQTINSDNTWYGLAVTGSSARTVSFESAKTQTIAANGALTLSGASGQLLTLAPLTPSTAWNLNVNATGVTQNITYVDVSYSDASSGTQVSACGGTNNDGGSNVNWNFCSDTGMFFQFF